MTPKRIPREQKERTWTVNYKFLEEIQEQAQMIYDYVGMEECESVILALVGMGFLELKKGEEEKTSEPIRLG